MGTAEYPSAKSNLIGSVDSQIIYTIDETMLGQYFMTLIAKENCRYEIAVSSSSQAHKVMKLERDSNGFANMK